MKIKKNVLLSCFLLCILIFSGCTSKNKLAPNPASQASEHYDTKEDGLPPLEDNLKQLYEDAETLYLRIAFSDFHCDLNERIEKNNSIYYKVDEPDLDSYESFQTYLSNYFTNNFIDKKILNPDNSRFMKGDNGDLYLLGAGRGSNIYYAGRVFHSVQRNENNEITFTATAYYANSQEAYEGEIFFTEPKNINDFSTQDFTFSLQKDGDTWKFDQFSCFI